MNDFSPGEHKISVPAGTKLKVPPQKPGRYGSETGR
jgi:hypothetical protein